MKRLYFRVSVPANGIDGEPLDPRFVREYIRDAVASWSGQFLPDEDNMFYWAGDGKTKVTRIKNQSDK